ncbi:MAG TPA: hypothetical protein VIP48_16710 [Streptosporangiaceae bacterium]
MPADYAKIRDENIARYGWDTAVLDLLGHLYSERTHFMYELIQNAEDAGATELSFELFPDRLEVSHDGRPFTEDDVRGICGVARTTKSAELTTIGQFGIGFKAVYAYTRTPRVYSPGEQFRIDNYVRPAAIEPLPEDGPGTRFVFPFDLDSVPAGVAAAEIGAALTALDPGILLFLRSITRIRAGGAGVTGSVIERRTEPGPGARRRVRLAKGGRGTDWLVWSRPLDHLGHAGRQVEVAFRADGEIVAQASSPLVVYFPTEKETSLGFLVQGPFRTTPARDNVPEHDPANQALVGEIAVLLTEVLADLRAGGLLTVAALQALPLDAARFPAGSMFRPLFDTVRGALAGGEFIPAADGGHHRPRDVRLCGEPELRDLLGPSQLGQLSGAGPLRWFTDAAITETGTPLVWHYLRDEIGVELLTPADFSARLSSEFLAAQTDEWITRLYAFLDGYPSLSRPGGPARDKPIIRLADGSQVTAFGPAGQPAVYLPGPASTGLRTVRRAIADEPAARHFLTGLGLAEPDLVAEVLDSILPRYDGIDVAQLDPAQHAADLECIMTALDQAPAGSRSRLLDQLQQTAFLVGENAGTGVQKMKPPGELYQRSRELEAYFGGNPDAWFAADGYGPWLMQLREMGVRAEVRLRARAADPLGHVVIADEFARHERGVDGFDPGAELDGLEFALRQPGHARSEYVWNVLLVPHRELAAGVVEKSVHDGFRDASRETVRSVLGAVAAGEAWLPGPDGRFRRPGELSLDDLPPAYRRDETLARALGMSQPAVAEAARQLGIPPDVLWGLSAHPDLVALIQRELKNRGPAL